MVQQQADVGAGGQVLVLGVEDAGLAVEGLADNSQDVLGRHQRLFVPLYVAVDRVLLDKAAVLGQDERGPQLSDLNRKIIFILDFFFFFLKKKEILPQIGLDLVPGLLVPGIVDDAQVRRERAELGVEREHEHPAKLKVVAGHLRVGPLAFGQRDRGRLEALVDLDLDVPRVFDVAERVLFVEGVAQLEVARENHVGVQAFDDAHCPAVGGDDAAREQAQKLFGHVGTAHEKVGEAALDGRRQLVAVEVVGEANQHRADRVHVVNVLGARVAVQVAAVLVHDLETATAQEADKVPVDRRGLERLEPDASE